nr:hypothetical protein CTI12_AA005950 [Tanacetum cinerariifolium]
MDWEFQLNKFFDSKGAIPTKTAADAKVAIQEMVDYPQKWHNRTSRTRSTETFDGLAAIQAQLNNLGREIKKVNEKELATVKYPKGIAENILVGNGKFIFPIDFIILDMPEDVKVPLILRRSFLSTTHAKIDVFKRKITLRVRDEKIIFKSVKPASSLIKRVYMLSLRERMEVDLEARLMRETLVLNRSLDPLYGDYIEFNDLNLPLELRRNQVDDLIPTIEKGEVVDKQMIEEVKARDDNTMIKMTTLAKHIVVGGAENRKKHVRMMLDSIDNGPLVYPTVENGQTRLKKYFELTEEQKLQDDCDVQATNIILHNLQPDVYALVNHYEVAEAIWDKGEMLYEYY